LYTDSGECSWYEFGKAVFEISGLKPDYGTVTSKQYGAKALRPAYSVLDNSRAHRLGIIPLQGWRDALTQYLELRSRA
jgi:dTDP-4-dehydrorhamnose reductase